MNYVYYLNYPMDSYHLLQDQVWDFLDLFQTQDTKSQFSSIVVNRQHVVTTHHIFFHWYDWKIPQYFCWRTIFHVIIITVIILHFVSWNPHLGHLCNPSNSFLYNMQSLGQACIFWYSILIGHNIFFAS